MTKPPIPEELSFEDLGENFMIIPYGVKTEYTDDPTPLSCHVYNDNKRIITSYMLSTEGEWRQLEQEYISEDSEVFYTTNPQDLFQTIFGVIGPDWESLHTVDTTMRMMMDIDPQELSDLAKNATSYSQNRSIAEQCTCNNSQKSENEFYQLDTEKILIEYCESCGSLTGLEHWDDGKKQTILSNATEISEFATNTSSIPVDPEMITETNHKDVFLLTEDSMQPTKTVLAAIPYWWESQKRNEFARQYSPMENNITFCSTNDELFGCFIWSFIQDIPVITHYWFDVNSPPIYRKTAIKSFEEMFDQSPTIQYPYESPTPINNFAPLTMISGAIKMQPE